MNTARFLVEDLRVDIDGTDVPVIDEVSFRLEQGEILGIVGESGSGKTTLGLALLAYARRGLRIAGGTVALEGVDLLGLGPPDLRKLRGRQIAYVAQDPASALNPALTIGLQLREVLQYHTDLDQAAREERLSSMLGEVRLDQRSGVLDAYPHQLSGGQLQRVALAMAFACRPQLIVFDEPTTGLDVTTQRHVLDTVATLCSTREVAAVYVSHDLAVVGDVATRVAVMYAGRIVDYGPAGAVFRQPAHPYTRQLLKALPTLDAKRRLQGIPGHPPRPGQRPAGCAFAPRCEHGDAECLAAPPAARVVAAGREARCVHAQAVLALPPLSARAQQVDAGPSGAGTHAIAVASLSASYGQTRVLYDVDLAVDSYECVAVVGESGSGKTTIARCISGLHSNWSGDVRLLDDQLARRATQRPLRQLQALQYVFQNPYASLNPRRTIRQLVEQPLQRIASIGRSERNERVASAVLEAALTEAFLDKYPGELSGGERQRVAIARALVCEPRVLVCDEVTSALDVSVQASIIELLRRLQANRGLAIVFITHNLPLVRSIAQRTIVLKEGRVVESGETETILASPQHPYTIELMRDAPRAGGSFENGSGTPQSTHNGR